MSRTLGVRAKGQAGFVITVEFLLLMVVIVVPLAIAGVVLTRKVITLYLNHREFLDMPYSRGVVWDSAVPPRVIGPAIGYNQFESPQMIYRVIATSAGVVLGVRRDRFTSFGEVFYTDPLCSATPRIRGWDSNVATGRVLGIFVDPLLSYPPIGFAYQTQERSYAMGSGNILYTSATPVGIDITSTDLPGVPVCDPLCPNPMACPPGLGCFFITPPETSSYVWRSQDFLPPDYIAPDFLLYPTSPPCFHVPIGVTVQNLVDGEFVIDFDGAGNYVAPFRLAFPTPDNTSPYTLSPEG